MKSTSKWFLIPPALAALLILGSVAMQGGVANFIPTKIAPTTGTAKNGLAAAAAPAVESPAATNTPPTTTTDTSGSLAARRSDPVLPRAPDLWQMASALAGVLLLGWGGVLVLRRLRRGARVAGGTSLLTLRQTLRLSSKQAIHAIEFDERILLVGEHERGLALLDSGRLPERAADEAELAARPATAKVDAIAGDDDDGAVPKDLVIPRPANQPVRRLPAPAAAPGKRPAPGLADFRNLLQKAARS